MIDWTVIISAVLGLLGSGIGALTGIIISSKLVNFRLEKLEKKFDLIDGLVAEQTELKSQLDSIMSIGSERRKKVDELESELAQMKNEVGKLNTRIALVENMLQLLQSGQLGHMDG